MKKIETNLKDCYIIEPDKFGDERGYYSPFFIEEKNVKDGITMNKIAQGARSLSGKGIVRGLHFQEDPSDHIYDDQIHESFQDFYKS